MTTALLTVAGVCLIIVLGCHPAAAMTGAEFAALPGPQPKLAEAERYARSFAAQGYADIPDAYSLTARMEMLVQEQGWQRRWLDIICLKAAHELGMHR